MEAYIKDFEKKFPATYVEQAEKIHAEFLAEFPQDKLSEMELDRYALGRSKSGSFCWWLEYHTTILGSIKGGSAAKLIIYYSPKNNEWKYPGEFPSVAAAWEKLRKDICALLDAYRVLPSPGISEDNLLNKGSMLKTKLLYLYYPDKFLPVYNLDHIKKFLGKMGIPKEMTVGKDSIECNQLLKEAVSKHKVLKTWHPIKVLRFFYRYYMEEASYYKISPGSDAIYWQDCLQGGFIAMGFNEVGDLTQYPDFEEFKTAFIRQNYYETATKSGEKAAELWTFYNLKPGDIVLANKGKNQLLGRGVVTERGYEYLADEAPQRHVVYVDWEEYRQPKQIPVQQYWSFKTIVQLTEKEVQGWMTSGGGGKGGFSAQEERFFEKVEKTLERKGQCILYGPPGTGKTYLARRFVHWKNAKMKLLPHPETSGRVWMMVTGTKMNFRWGNILDNGGLISFSKGQVYSNFSAAQKGDKVLCYQGGDSDRGFVGIAEIEEPYQDEKGLIVKGIRPFSEVIPFDEIKEETPYLRSQAGSMGNRGTMFMVENDFVELVAEKLLEKGDQESARMLRDFSRKANLDICTFHPSFNYEDFIEGYKPQTQNGLVSFELSKGIFTQLCEKAQQDNKIPYYLIIDEINRGNVPKIFGEIITLLEKDKRGLQIRLPQSKGLFAIPENVYIIGTMNTSDRSIKFMDAALKRRFGFIECMPQLNLIDEQVDTLGMSPAQVLAALNAKLIGLVGRDKQIGHAYFMRDGEQIRSVSEFKTVFETDIIPLIQDYCFDDYGRLAEIIGQGFVDVENMMINTEIFEGPEDAFIAEIEKTFRE